MSDINTLAANMRNAFIERKGATIGGGKFTPEELKAGAVALNAYTDLLNALYLALPFLEDCAMDDCYKPGYVNESINIIKAAIAKAEQ